MSIFCPKCLHEWNEDDNDEKIASNGFQCKYCKTFFIDMNYVVQTLRENGIKNVNFEFYHLGDENDD